MVRGTDRPVRVASLNRLVWYPERTIHLFSGGLIMVKVEILKSVIEGTGEVIASLELTAVPLSNPKDYSCTPAGAVSFASAQRIADGLAVNRRAGAIGALEWRR